MRTIVAAMFLTVLGFQCLAQTIHTLDKRVVKQSQHKFEQSDNPHISRHAYVLSRAIWRNTKTIYVCWENPAVGFSQEMALVQQAISETWQRVSQLSFTGWKACTPDNAGVHILIDDSGPRTKALGADLDSVPNGMMLNFTFNNWSDTCRTKRAYCIHAIAIHEFGHAIGFAHEQNRPDTPGECQIMHQGKNGDILLTPYDPDSIMNYCNQRWNNDGHLSVLDTKAVQELYGVHP